MDGCHWLLVSPCGNQRDTDFETACKTWGVSVGSHRLPLENSASFTDRGSIGAWCMNLDHQSVLEKPVILIGSPRSGTSFLSQLLKRHRTVAYIGEPRLTWRYGNDHRSDMLRARDARDEVVTHIRSAFSKQVLAEGKQRLVEKTPSNALRLDFVDRVFPDAKFVHIMRHGMDSALSIQEHWRGFSKGVRPRGQMKKGTIRQRLREIRWRQAPYYVKEIIRRVSPKLLSGVTGPAVWGPRIPGLDGLVRDLDLLEACCLQWRMCVESACHWGRQLPEDRYFECRLEDMSPGLVKSILGFCELDEDPDVMTYFYKKYDPQKASARTQRCTADERQTVLRWIEPTLRWLGYDEDETKDQTDPSDPSRLERLQHLS